MNPEQYMKELVTSQKYIHMMTVLFPYWMSLTPGGKNYKMGMKLDVLEEQVDRWDDALELLLSTANELQINISGTGYMKVLYDLQDESHWEKLLYSTNMRDIRKRWKKVMGRLGWDFSDSTWRDPNRDIPAMHDEWARFREAWLYQ